MIRPARSLRPRERGDRSMVVGCLLAALLVGNPLLAQVLLPPDPSVAVGRVVPFEGFVDENGRAFATAGATDGRPWIVSPIYTRCLHTCAPITQALRSALARSGLQTSNYHVVSFSFDPNETADGLRGFRDKMHLPADWLTLRAETNDALQRTLEALDFRTITVGDGEIDHPNLVAVLAPDRRLAEYLFGISPSTAPLRAALSQPLAGGNSPSSSSPRSAAC